MFSLLGNSKRDEYGVGDLLAEVSKRSASISTEDRKEIEDISKRLRGGNSSFTNLYSSLNAGKSSQQTPENSQHDGSSTGSASSPLRKNFGRDLLKVGLLRGFGTGPSIEQAPSSRIEDSKDTKLPRDPVSGGSLLRGFGPSKRLVVEEHCDSEEDHDSDSEASS